METIEVGEKELKEYLTQAKEALAKGHIAIKGYSRDTVKAVDLAEELKLENFKVKHLTIGTDEKEIEGKKQRTSHIIIEMEK